MDPSIIGRVSTPQGGIFALGTASHAYLEFDAQSGRNGQDLVAAISALREPRTTMGGVNLVAGFRPELWGEVASDDALLWLSGIAYDVIFDTARGAIAELSGLARWSKRPRVGPTGTIAT